MDSPQAKVLMEKKGTTRERCGPRGEQSAGETAPRKEIRSAPAALSEGASPSCPQGQVQSALLGITGSTALFFREKPPLFGSWFPRSGFLTVASGLEGFLPLQLPRLAPVDLSVVLHGPQNAVI